MDPNAHRRTDLKCLEPNFGRFGNLGVRDGRKKCTVGTCVKMARLREDAPRANPTWATSPTNGMDLSLPRTRHNSRTQRRSEKCAQAKSQQMSSENATQFYRIDYDSCEPSPVHICSAGRRVNLRILRQAASAAPSSGGRVAGSAFCSGSRSCS